LTATIKKENKVFSILRKKSIAFYALKGSADFAMVTKFLIDAI